jgi:hypothetical protein
LTETTLSRPESRLNQLIAFPAAPRVTAGVRYAIVVNYVGAPPGNHDGVWDGTSSNPYPLGQALFSDDGGLTWFRSGDFESDLFFRTYVEVGPRTATTKADCKNGGWRNLANDQGEPFRNQGRCVSYVVAHRR